MEDELTGLEFLILATPLIVLVILKIIGEWKAETRRQEKESARRHVESQGFTYQDPDQ